MVATRIVVLEHAVGLPTRLRKRPKPYNRLERNLRFAVSGLSVNLRTEALVFLRMHPRLLEDAVWRRRCGKLFDVSYFQRDL